MVLAVQQSAISIESMANALKEVSNNTINASNLSQQADVQTKETAQVMSFLVAAAHEIDKILKIINDIAAQINLLSLNATIEVANASGSGKVFTVLAKEAKVLARRTSEETELISNRVEEIQNAIASAVETLNKITSVIHNLNFINSNIATSVEDQAETTNIINATIFSTAANAKKVSEFVKSINTSTEGININVSNTMKEVIEIMKSYNNIAHIADNVSKRSTEASHGVTEIAKSTGEINTGLHEISSNLLKILNGSNQFSREAENIRITSDSLNQLSKHLDDLVNTFKV
jgi:methyl-accepting chemotaxis protein